MSLNTCQYCRYLRKLKNNIRNKAKVEGSICNAYMVEEASSFCSYYFEDHVSTKYINMPQNYVGGGDSGDVFEDNHSISKHSGCAFGRVKSRFLTDE